MNVDQIVIRPSAREIVVQFINSAGIAGNTLASFDALPGGDSVKLDELLKSFTSLLPKDPSESVLAEVRELEARLVELRKQISVG